MSRELVRKLSGCQPLVYTRIHIWDNNQLSETLKTRSRDISQGNLFLPYAPVTPQLIHISSKAFILIFDNGSEIFSRKAFKISNKNFGKIIICILMNCIPQNLMSPSWSVL